MVFCFEVIVDWLLTDIQIGRQIREEGVAFIIEDGHQNNGEVKDLFYAKQSREEVSDVLKSIDFVPKNDSRAIQLADLIAFYARRDAVDQYKASREKRRHEPDLMMKVIAEGIDIRGFTATDFDG